MSQPDNIRVSTIDKDSPVSTVRVDGIVDTITSKEVDRAIAGLISCEQYRIVMDLAGVDYISSAGWGVFISHLKEAREHSGDLRLAGMIPNVREIFELLEFDTILNSFATSSQAAQSFESELPVLQGGPRTPEKAANGGLDELAAIGVDAPSLPAIDRQGAGRQDIKPSTAHDDDRFVSGSAARSLENVSFENVSFADILKELIVEDPFSTITELRSELKNKTAGSQSGSLSWWGVFRTLRREGLLSRRSRFKLARRQMKKQQSKTSYL